MKKMILTVCGLMTLLLLIMICYTFYGRSVRKAELEAALSSGMQKAVNMLDAGEYAPRDNEEFIALFLEAFAVEFQSSSDVTVHVLDADVRKGLLSAEAILVFRHPIGTEGRVAARRTIIREAYSEAGREEQVVVQYMVDGKVYKRYELKKDATLIAPKEPAGEFAGWRELDGDSIVTMDNRKADRDYIFVAVFR
mgnify:CR=1 FL=1